MARIPAAPRLTAEELDEPMASSWNIRIATVGPGQRINLTPLWFAWTAGQVYFYGRGQKIAMFQGRAGVLENAEQEDADPHAPTTI